jgi:hypothetical protein
MYSKKKGQAQDLPLLLCDCFSNIIFFVKVFSEVWSRWNKFKFAAQLSYRTRALPPVQNHEGKVFHSRATRDPLVERHDLSTFGG